LLRFLVVLVWLARLFVRLGIRCPQGKIVSKQLHDEGRILVGVLVERVQLGDGVVERLLGQVARALRRVEDFVVEHGEVEREAEPNRVRGLHLRLGDVERLAVGLLRVLNHRGSVLASGHLG